MRDICDYGESCLSYTPSDGSAEPDPIEEYIEKQREEYHRDFFEYIREYN